MPNPEFEALTFIVPYPAPQEDISACFLLLKARRVASCTEPRVVAALWVGADEAPSGDRVLRDPDGGK
jgi:hypothetical protein